MAVRFDTLGEDYSASGSFATDVFTVTCWFLIDVDRNDFQSMWVFVDGSNYTLLQTDSDGVTVFYFDSAISTLFTATVGTWYFVAISKAGTGANQTTAYWAAANAASLSTSSFTQTQSAGVFTEQIGNDQFNEWINGRIAAFKRWDSVALSQAEIENERLQYLPHRTANLQVFYPFLEGGGTAGARQNFQGNNGLDLAGGTGSVTADGPPIPWRRDVRKLIKVVPAGSSPDPGGYYLLENGTDRYLLEDSSGLYLLENTAGDLRFPAWSPRQGSNTLIRL